MIDGEILKKAYSQVRRTCLGCFVSPLILTFVAWRVYRSSNGFPGGPGSGEVPLPWLIGISVVALSPLALVPIAQVWMRKSLASPDRPDAAQRLRALLPLEAYVGSSLWEVPAVLGFVGFFMGASWWFYLTFLTLSYVGLALSFPRWSRWMRRVETLNALAGTERIPMPL